ncbi:hypothetical protein OK016_27140 [Vibrio chagasii]|nr:hypothetical protein [Vibrio chagasii]
MAVVEEVAVVTQCITCTDSRCVPSPTPAQLPASAINQPRSVRLTLWRLLVSLI